MPLWFAGLEDPMVLMAKREVEGDAMCVRTVRFATTTCGTAFFGLFASSQMATSRRRAKDLTRSGDLETFANGLIGFSHGRFSED